DPGELVERRLGAVVVDQDPLDERGRRAAGADALEVALHDLDGPGHLAFRARQGLGAHQRLLPDGAPEIRVPTGSPIATRRMLSGLFRSNTMIGRSFSMHRLTAVASRTLSRSRSRSAYSRCSYRRAFGWVSGSASYTPSTLVAFRMTSAP